MISARTTTTSCRTLASKQTTSILLKAFHGPAVGLRPGAAALSHQQPWTSSRRSFSSTPSHSRRPFSTSAPHEFKTSTPNEFAKSKAHEFSVTIPQEFSASETHGKEFFPQVETKKIRETPAAWAHPIYSREDMLKVAVAHREARDWADRVALMAVKVLRWGLDLVSGYRHNKALDLATTDPAAAARKYGMTESRYMARNIFLESVAGVPGMVAGMLRHLHSMRRMKRDNGWMETLLEESYNERMHLLTFLRLGEPGLFMRAAVLGAQGVFFNAFFVAYLIAPRICHRFVGYLEEEAVLTYTREIEDIDKGRLPEWSNLEAPDIAIKYWNMPEGQRSMRDLLLYIRADEAKHREVNHTLGNLDQKNDPNPYVSVYKEARAGPRPTKGIEYLQPTGWERGDVIGVESGTEVQKKDGKTVELKSAKDGVWTLESC